MSDNKAKVYPLGNQICPNYILSDALMEVEKYDGVVLFFKDKQGTIRFTVSDGITLGDMAYMAMRLQGEFHEQFIFQNGEDDDEGS